MAKKNETSLSAAIVKQLKGMGFNCKTEEDARKKLLAALEKEGVEGMEDESLETLIDMVSGFCESEAEDEEEVEETDEDDSEVEEDDEESEANALADEAEDEEEAEEVAEEEEDDDEEEDEVSSDDSEAEEEEDKKPAKPAKENKAKKQPAPKKAPAKKSADKKQPAKRGNKLNPKSNEEDKQELINAFSKMFPEDTFTYAFVVNGVTIKYNGSNCKRGVFLFDNVSRHGDKIVGNLYLLTMSKEVEKLDELGIDYGICWTKAPFIKGVSIEEANEILEKVYDIITAFVTKVDKRLGDNRKKMEDNLKKAAKTKVAAKKTETPVDDEEDDEPEDKQPAPKKAPAKKSTKKAKK